MGWKVGPDRFVQSGRQWLPKWRFSPLTRLDDAFELLDRSAAVYTLNQSSNGVFAAEVHLTGRVGTACGPVKARAIALAVARALELETPE